MRLTVSCNFSLKSYAIVAQVIGRLMGDEYITKSEIEEVLVIWKPSP